jgi:hypothetical protein
MYDTGGRLSSFGGPMAVSYLSNSRSESSSPEKASYFACKCFCTYVFAAGFYEPGGVLDWQSMNKISIEAKMHPRKNNL